MNTNWNETTCTENRANTKIWDFRIEKKYVIKMGRKNETKKQQKSMSWISNEIDNGLNVRTTNTFEWNDEKSLKERNCVRPNRQNVK